MSTNRLFHGKPVRRLIVSVELTTVEAIDNHMKESRTRIHGNNRSEFVRRAIESYLHPCSNTQVDE